MADKKNKNVAFVFASGLDEAVKQVIVAAIAAVEGLKYEILEGVVSEAEHADVLALENGHLEEIKNLKAKVQAADDHILKLSEEMTTMSAELGSLTDAAEKGYLTVKSGKKTYRVTGKKFNYKGRDYTIDDLLKNPKLVDELIGLKVGFLTEVKEDK